ncbi:hypothetical protein K0M31_015936 [Melipona bicolor]|uniref:Uncharacterized protein n=1 Tax=Melipona bicolor TaxID=60889 RepID=A0AA40G672_9HYME|nr:hypothetical protein K0M31_015936 [Melipona bicolor]
MSDTYQNIQSQSDIEWKYGLSKLIRKMQKTRTAPSPLNLITSWISYIGKIYKNRSRERKTGIMRLLAGHTFSQDNGLVSQQHDVINFPLLQSSPLESQLSLKDSLRIENIVDWDFITRKYRVRFGNEIEKSPPEDSSTKR